jgi:Ycf66 protein N-terminus
MLAYILALAVGLGSLGIYLAAFFVPEVHRKSDFYWSGVGLFYALMLWVCAGRITGGVLLGQMAGVALLGWFGWQTLTLRRQLIPPEQQTELPSQAEAAETVKATAASLKENLQSKLSNSSLPEKVGGLLTTVKDRIQGIGGAAKRKAQPGVKIQPPKPAPLTSLPKEALVEEPDSEAEAIAPDIDADETIVISEIPKVSSPFEAIAKTEPVPPTESESSPQNNEPELIRPNPPNLELVEEAVEDAEAKHLPSSPPPTTPDNQS